jgi:hypothetical protein
MADASSVLAASNVQDRSHPFRSESMEQGRGIWSNRRLDHPSAAALTEADYFPPPAEAKTASLHRQKDSALDFR